jgi:hypothetical protein
LNKNKVFVWYEKLNTLYGVFAPLAGSYANGIFQVSDENLAVPDPSGLRAFNNRVHNFVQLIVGDYNFQFNLGKEIDHVLGATVQLGMSFLPAESFPLIPISFNLSLTSSSLNGLITASTFFIGNPLNFKN